MNEDHKALLAEFLAADDERTQGEWVEDDGHIHSKNLSEQVHAYVIRLLEDKAFAAQETDDQINRPEPEVARCDQSYPNFEKDAAFIALSSRLRPMVEGLVRESERLQWMLDNTAFVSPATIEGMWLCVWLKDGGQIEEISEPYRSPREAIDAAMTKSEGGEKS